MDVCTGGLLRMIRERFRLPIMEKAGPEINAFSLLACCLVLLLAAGLQGCRRVSLVGDSLLGSQQHIIVSAINDNGGDSWVYTEEVWNGSTAYNNPVNHKIYGAGVSAAFGVPDVVVLSFATNDMGRVAADEISFESAVQAMQTLLHQAVAAGAMCLVLLESSHHLRFETPQGERFEMLMDDWFRHWHSLEGSGEYLGIPYTLLIADISEQVEADMDTYISDYIHFTVAGAELAARAIVEQINQCPEGRWIFSMDALKPGVVYPANPHMGYVAPSVD